MHHWRLEMELDSAEYEAFLLEPENFIVQKMRGCEVSYNRLSEEDRDLFDEAMSRELSQYLSQKAIRKCLSDDELKEAHLSNRIMQARGGADLEGYPRARQA